MNTLIRSGIVTVAGAVAVGALGIGVASVAQADDNDPVLKREDTSSSWVVPSADTDDDNGDLDDGPTTNTANSVNSTNSRG